MERDLTRRKIITRIGTAGAVSAIAGCSTNENNGGGGSSPGDPQTEEPQTEEPKNNPDMFFNSLFSDVIWTTDSFPDIKSQIASISYEFESDAIQDIPAINVGSEPETNSAFAEELVVQDLDMIEKTAKEINTILSSNIVPQYNITAEQVTDVHEHGKQKRKSFRENIETYIQLEDTKKLVDTVNEYLLYIPKLSIDETNVNYYTGLPGGGDFEGAQGSSNLEAKLFTGLGSGTAIDTVYNEYYGIYDLKTDKIIADSNALFVASKENVNEAVKEGINTYKQLIAPLSERGQAIMWKIFDERNLDDGENHGTIIRFSDAESAKRAYTDLTEELITRGTANKIGTAGDCASYRDCIDSVSFTLGPVDKLASGEVGDTPVYFYGKHTGQYINLMCATQTAWESKGAVNGWYIY